MGMPTSEKTERNAELYKDITSGKFSIIDLVKKYDITPARIYQIKNKYEKKRA